MRMRAALALEAASANYDSPSPDGSRPGRVSVNTYDETSRKILFMEATAYHEGVPERL